MVLCLFLRILTKNYINLFINLIFFYETKTTFDDAFRRKCNWL